MPRNHIVALLPMKGHSARIPGKNFKEFAGKPLFRWVLDTLLAVQEIDQVVINTDAVDTLRSYGIETDRVILRERKPEICGDAVSMNRVLADDVDHVPADIYLMTHTTNPLLTADTVRHGLALFKKQHAAGICDSLFSVNRFQTRFYSQDGDPVNHDPENLIPTQDLEPWYEENSNLYIFTQESFLETRARIGRRPVLFETPRLESTDIDTPADWDLAEYIVRHRLAARDHDQRHHQDL
ncbi:MAG: acylneuraminate cytidylyltransferase family protein [Opitutales bacterium]|nr:acylneuraminate cytidylyltransferase family protein [Opitutales bacterium]